MKNMGLFFLFFITAWSLAGSMRGSSDPVEARTMSTSTIRSKSVSKGLALPIISPASFCALP